MALINYTHKSNIMFDLCVGIFSLLSEYIQNLNVEIIHALFLIHTYISGKVHLFPSHDDVLIL